MWPAFHEGELAMQRRMGVDHASRRMADYVTQSTLQDPSHRFLTQRPLVAAAYTDLDGRVRLTLLWGPTGFIRIPRRPQGPYQPHRRRPHRPGRRTRLRRSPRHHRTRRHAAPPGQAQRHGLE